MTNREPATEASVWAMIQESHQKLQEFHCRVEEEHKKTEQMLQESIAVDKLRREEDKLRREEDKLRREEDKLRREESDARGRRLDARLDKIAKLVGDAGNNTGRVAEQYFYRSLKKNKKIGNLQYDYISPNVKRDNGKTMDEFDIMLYNGTSVAVIEVKQRVTQAVLNELVTAKIQHFREMFKEFRDRTVYLGIGGMCFDDGVESLAREKGVFILRQNGDAVVSETEHLKPY